ncbi:MAG: hypothetical protein KF726_03160 [Anaerolineae bacterium]|nr:hypothetical protein [Anaerolineae bacterium]
MGLRRKKTAVAAPTATNWQEVKSQLAALTSEQFDALKNVYHYRWLASSMQRDGWLNLILGGITVWGAWEGQSFNSLWLIQLVLGLAIVGQSLWMLSKPDTAGLLRFSILLAAVGIYNITGPLLRGNNGTTVTIVAGLGLLQLWMAYTVYGLYQKRKDMTITKPTAEQDRLYDVLWAQIINMSLSSNDDNDYLEATMQGKWWQGFLLGDRVILAKKNAPPKWMIVANAPEVTFDTKQTVTTTTSQIRGKMKFGILTLTAALHRVFFARLVEWKTIFAAK